MEEYVERLVDLTEPEANQIYNLSIDDARELILRHPEQAHQIHGSFALIAKEGKTVRMARSLDRRFESGLNECREVTARELAAEDWMTNLKQWACSLFAGFF